MAAPVAGRVVGHPSPHAPLSNTVPATTRRPPLPLPQPQLMNEFDDVSDREKPFMKAWNLDVVVPNSLLPGRCVDFLETNLTYVLEHGLWQKFLLHLLTLWDSSVISSVTMCSVIACIDDLVANRAA